MACSIIRTGEVTTVFDEGGNVSTLFQEAMREFNDVEQALDVFYTSRSQEFSDNSGVFYRNATLSDVLRFYTNYGVSSSNVQVFSPKETVEVVDAMKNMGLKSIYEFNEVMQEMFHNAEGVFEIDAEKLVKSGYYTMEEVLALESSEIIHTLNRLSKFVLTGFDIIVSDAEYSGYKNTTVQKNMFGAYPFISSLEVKQYIAENGLESLEGTPYRFVLDNSLEGVSGKQRVKTERKVKDITREDTVERLSKTSLANKVHILSTEGIRGVLDRIGFSEQLKNQIVSYRGIRKALDVLNTKTNHRDYGEMMNGIYFGELPVALAFAGYSVFSPSLEEHSQLFRAKIDDSKFVTIDMKGHTPGSDENFIKIVGEERYLKLLEQKRSGEITGMKLINAPEFLHGEEKQVQYVVFDRELIEITASFRDKALQDLGAMTLRLSTEGVQLTPNGFVYKGDVYLNNDVYETETAVHEFSHLYLDRLKEVNPFLYERGIELIKKEGIEYINHVRRTQPNLVGERLYEEALAQATGEEGAKIVDEGKRNKFLSFIRDLWESIKSSLGLSGMTYDQASKLNLKEYSRAIAIDLLSGEPLNNFGNKTDGLNVNSVEFSFLEQSELDSQGNIRPEVARAIRAERVRIENEARGYFTREADRLPLTLAIFNTKPFQDLQGKQVKPVTIQQLLNKTGIKQIEKDLINQILSDNYSGQKRISYDEFEATVRVNIMPLERLTTSSYADYGMHNLGDGNYGEAKTLILNSPIEHGVTGHFSGDFKASARQNIKYVPKQLNDNTWVAVEEGYESQANDNNIYQFVGTAGTKEAVDLWIIKYDLSQGKIFDNKKYLVYQDAYDQVDNVLPLAGFDTEQEAKDFIEQNRNNYSYSLDYVDEQYLKDKWNLEEINKGMFGHIRVWQDGQDFYAAEMQSDYFQKNNARKDILENNEEYKEAKKVKSKEEDKLKDKREEAFLKLRDLGYRFVTGRRGASTQTEVYIPKNIYGLPLGDRTGVKLLEKDGYYTIDNNGINPNGNRYIDKQLAEANLERLANEESIDFDEITYLSKSELPLELHSDFDFLTKNYYQEQKNIEKNFNQKVEKIVQSLPKDQKQFIASQKVWVQRMVREAIKEATLSGATSLLFPTPYTLSVIEGYIRGNEATETTPYQILEGDSNSLKEGDVINYLDKEYIIVEANENAIKIVDKVQDDITQEIIDDILIAKGSEQFVKENKINDDRYIYGGFYFEDGTALFVEKVKKPEDFETNERYLEEGLFESQELSKQAYFEKYREEIEDVVGKMTDEEFSEFIEDSDRVQQEKVNLSVENASKDFNGQFELPEYSPTIEEIKEDVSYYSSSYRVVDNRVYSTESAETLKQPDKYTSQKSDGFDIATMLSEEEQTVVRKYEETAEILRKERGDNFEVVTDKNGFDWYKTKITPEDSQQPVIAFQINAIEQERLRIENEARGYFTTEQELQQIKAQAIANGTFMKAPNGKDTNLNERQWLQVRSQAFTDWFGDWLNDPENASKVVDENGEPMVVYHGTDSDFRDFSVDKLNEDPDYGVRGFYFGKLGNYFQGRKNTISSFLNIRNPANLKQQRNPSPKTEKELMSQGFDGFIPKNISGVSNKDIEKLNIGEKIKKGYKELVKVDDDGYGNNYEYYEDGDYVMSGTFEDMRYIFEDGTFVAFNPNQIISATDNVGTFSSESDNINFQIIEEQGDQNLDQVSKAFNEGVEAVAKLANEYKKEFGIDSVQHNKVGKLFPAVSKMIAEAYEQAETGMTTEEVKETYKALEEETLQQYKFIVDKGLKVSRWTGKGEPYPNSKSMLKDVRENNHLYFLPNSEAFGKEGDEVEGRAGLKKTDFYLEDGYRMTLSEVFRVVHDYFGHGILGNQFGAVGEENATLQHLDLYSFEALPAVIFQTRGQNSWVNFSGANDEALRKIREGSKTNNKNLLEQGQKEFVFAVPKDNILPKIFNFKTYETARRINEQEEIRKSEAYLDPRGKNEDTNISELLTRHTSRNSGKLNGFSRRSLGVSKRVGGYDVDVIAEYKGNQEVESLIKNVFPEFKGTQKIYEITNGDVYREMMIEALETNKFKSSVTVHSAEDFSNMRLFVTEDGSTGITLTKDGFLGGAFGNPKANRPHNLPQMMLLGIKEGALTAEAFDTVLPNYYSLFGFKAVSRTAFNDEYRPLKENGALEDWDYELYSKFNNGRPDVVFFIYDGGNRESIQSRLGQFDSYSGYQKQFTEYYDKDSYDDAYRFMEVEAINKSNYQNQEVNFQTNAREQRKEQIKSQAIANGTWMKAPNGKPSNLSEEQWVTVRTERFKSWFGDWENDPENASKVVDENGEPMVMYHSTKSGEFFEFDPEKIGSGAGILYGRGFYFESRKEEAKWYTQGEGRVIEVFLNSRNPVNYYGATEVGRARADGVSDNLNEDDVFEGGQFMVKSPNQIKSATDNIGTFNTESNDIRFSISNSNTNFTEDETTRYYTDSQGKRIPFKRYSPHDDSTKSNLLQQEEGQGLGESTDFALVERQFIEDKNLNFTAGTRIESLNDVAWLFRSLENEAVENSFVVYIDEEGGYTVQHLGQGGITSVIVDSRLIVGNAVKYGAKSVAFVHNHPSGALKASIADMSVLSNLRRGFRETGVELLDGVIINLKTGKYVTFDEYSEVVEEITEQNQEQHKVQVLSFSKQIFSENYNPVKITSSKDVAELITTKRFGVSDKTEMLVLNNSNEVVGKFVLPEENQYAKITELLTQYGGVSVILYGNKIDSSQIIEYNKRLKLIGATILDAIEVKSDNYTSLGDQGLLYEPNKEYSVSPQENKTLQEAEEQEQLKRLNLEKLNEISEEYEQGNRVFKRLPQREQSGFTRIGRAGIEAAIHLDAVFGANEDGTANKAEQERALKEYAKRSNVWVEDVVQQKGEPHTEGQEALVWFNEDTNIVTKSILPLEQTPQEFLDRVSIHNSIFPETQIKVIGFTETKSGDLQYIVEQPLVIFERGATQTEVSEMMSELGFEHTGENDYANNETLIEDLHTGNALIDINTGRVVVIDPIIRLNTKEAGYGGERVVGTNNVSELEKSLAEEEVRQQEVEQENIFKRDVLNTLVKNNLISNDTFLQLSSLESFNVENVSLILRNNEEAFEGMSDRSIGKKLMSLTPVNFEHIFNNWGERFSNKYVEDYVDSLIRNNVVEMRDEDNNLCAANGLFFNGVKFGGTWEVVKDLKGKPSHKRGGVDIELTEKGVKVAKGGADIIAEKGLVFRDN